MADAPRAVNLMTVDELADTLQVQRHTVLNWRSSGQWPDELPRGFKIGRFVYFDRDAVLEALRAAARIAQEAS